MPLMFILFDVSKHIRLHVCARGPACVRTSERAACVRLIECMHVCADLRECMFGKRWGCRGIVHWGESRVEHGSSVQ